MTVHNLQCGIPEGYYLSSLVRRGYIPNKVFALYANSSGIAWVCRKERTYEVGGKLNMEKSAADSEQWITATARPVQQYNTSV